MDAVESQGNGAENIAWAVETVLRNVKEYALQRAVWSVLGNAHRHREAIIQACAQAEAIMQVPQPMAAPSEHPRETPGPCRDMQQLSSQPAEASGPRPVDDEMLQSSGESPPLASLDGVPERPGSSAGAGSGDQPTARRGRGAKRRAPAEASAEHLDGQDPEQPSDCVVKGVVYYKPPPDVISFPADMPSTSTAPPFFPAAALRVLGKRLDVRGVAVVEASGATADEIIAATTPLPGVDVRALYAALTDPDEALDMMHRNWSHQENNIGDGGGGEEDGIYGTVTQKGTAVVFGLLVLLTDLNAFSRVVDAGAGLGKPLVHAALLGVRNVWGFEMSKSRVEAAKGLGVVYSQKFTERFGRAAGKFILKHWPVLLRAQVHQLPDDLLEWTTHLYAFWEGWNPWDKAELARLVNASSRLRGLAFVQRGSGNVLGSFEAAGFKGLRLVAVCRHIKMSGGSSFVAYIFQRDPPAAARRK